MKIALASAPVRSGDVAYNLTQMAKYISLAKEQGAELVCFGEAYLQGFDALTWNFEEDRSMAVSCNSGLFQIIAGWTRDSAIDVLFGFLEREGDTIYSSCALVSGGALVMKYRRVSQGWKEYWKTDAHYREGECVGPFLYHGKVCMVALCGDLWDESAPRFRQSADLLIWPVYINYTKEEWENSAQMEYAQKAAEFCGDVLLINPVDKAAHGGSCWFQNGTVKAALPMNEEGLLVVEV